LKGLEKLNDLSTRQFFSSTNKKGDAIKQMLEKDFRVAYLETIVGTVPLTGASSKDDS